MTFFKNLRARFTRPASSMRVADAPLAHYLHPDGRITPIGTKSWGFDNWYGTNTQSGLNVNYSSPGLAYAYAINVWVNRCVEIRGSAIARLDWYVEDVRSGKRIDDHDFIVALKTSRRNIMKLMSYALDIWGECYLKPLENLHGYYSRIFWMNPTTTQMVITNGRITRFFYVPTQGGRAVQYDRDEVAYLYSFNPFNDLRGLSKLSSVLEEVQISEEIARTVRAFYAHDARPGLMLIPEHDLDPSRAQEFMDYWKDNFQGSANANRPVMLPKNIKTIQEMNRSPAQADVELREATRRELCAAFGVPLSIAGAWDDANYQSAPEQRKSLYEDTIIPYAEDLAKMMTEELLPFWDDRNGVRVWFDPTNLLALSEDLVQKTTALTQRLLAGGMSLNEYREAFNDQPLTEAAGQMYYIPTTVLPTPIDKIGTTAPAINPFTGMQQHPAAQLGTQAAQPALPTPVEDAQKAGKSVSVLLTLPDNVDLLSLQRRLQEIAGDAPIQWNEPSDYHITLLNAPNCDDEQIEQLRSALEGITPQPMALTIGSLNVFDNIGEHALHFRIRRDDDLLDLQDALYNLCGQLGIQTSAYSQPAAYKPHVTMGYAPTRIRPITFHSKLAVQPDALVMSVKETDGTYKVLCQRALSTPQAVATKTDDAPPDETWLSELEAWQKFSIARLGKKNARPFETHVLTADVVSVVSAGLEVAMHKKAVIAAFDLAREYVAQKWGVAAKSEDFVTPAQAMEWWRDYDMLMAQIGGAWLNDYMRQAWNMLQAEIDEGLKPRTVQKVLNSLHDTITTEWVGTVDQPGVLSQLVMAGMAVGQRALVNQRTNLNPNKAELNIDWELVPKDAIEFVRKYAFDLIKEIDATTVSEVQVAVEKWLQSGGTLSELQTALQGVFNDPVRADAIARTESSRAYQNGAEQRWKEAGVSKARFRTVQSSDVCHICKPLNGQVADIKEGWYSRVLGKYVRPPCHVNCRCYSQPVLDD